MTTQMRVSEHQNKDDEQTMSESAAMFLSELHHTCIFVSSTLCFETRRQTRHKDSITSTRTQRKTGKPEEAWGSAFGTLITNGVTGRPRPNGRSPFCAPAVSQGLLGQSPIL